MINFHLAWPKFQPFVLFPRMKIFPNVQLHRNQFHTIGHNNLVSWIDSVTILRVNGESQILFMEMTTSSYCQGRRNEKFVFFFSTLAIVILRESENESSAQLELSVSAKIVSRAERNGKSWSMAFTHSRVYLFAVQKKIAQTWVRHRPSDVPKSIFVDGNVVAVVQWCCLGKEVWGSKHSKFLFFNSFLFCSVFCRFALVSVIVITLNLICIIAYR